MRLIFFAIVLFTFSCKDGPRKTGKVKPEVIKTALSGSFGISSFVQLRDSVDCRTHSSNNIRSCCAGPPSRFRKNIIENLQNK